ncbi:DUF6491 family protein [Hyphococcus sp.]|uniref:DUF6491 family protein n=1 Tax=Hyphococcus sp. TaxID=2038636 RepID=UPI003CCC3BA9
MNTNLSLIAAAGFGTIAMTAACGTSYDNRDGPRMAEPDPRIGEEVSSICFQNSINGWRAIEGEDDVVLLERGVNNWYRVELAGACDSRLFRSALSIGIDSSPAGSCVRRGDVIIVEDTPGFSRRCTITEINEWDEDALVERDEANAMNGDSY